MKYKIFALLILIIFYSIFFIKMLIQKKQGIKTRQVGTIKEKRTRIIETLMSASTLLVVPIQIISIFLDYNFSSDYLRYIGLLISTFGDIIFLISVITMKNSWRVGISKNDKTKLITNGIYKISRNPAFLGFDLMYIGIALLYSNPFTIIFSLFAITMLHLQILEEEKYLEKSFKNEYISYKNKINRYLGIKR